MEGRTQENRLNTRSLICAALLSCAVLPVHAQSHDDALARGFVNPPAAAKPRVWWHWMNGNVTRAGIEQDLEWMQRVGIGGVHNFDAALGTPPLVEQRLIYMTPPWRDAMRHAAQMTDRMGMELGIAGSPGFSESGGPWVRPEQAMKKLVWSETTIEGGRKFTERLPQPPMSTGPMQDLPLPEYSFRPDPAPLPFYVDSAVVAYRQSRAESELDRLRPQVTSNAGKVDAALLSDGALAASTNLPKAAVGERAWVQLEYPRPATVTALTLAVRRPYHPFANFMPVPESGRTLEASDDGKTFRRIADIPGGRIDRRTLGFPAVTARFFRVTFTTLPPGFDPLRGRDLDGTPLPKPDAHEILELTLHAGARVGYFEEKAAFAASTLTLADLPTPESAEGAAIGRSAVLDLTTKLRADGTLDWTPPPGRWTVLRMGYSLTGHKNGPASAEATGLEVDKLDAGAVRAYFTTYLDQYRETLGPLMGARGLQYIVTDSWEAGQQNWTGNLIAEFTRRRGYSPLPFLPVLTGRVVESARASDAFLWDFRRTLADLVAEYHYETLSSLLRERQLARYTESHENRRAFVADGMEVKRTAQIPMSAIWAQLPGDAREDFARYADVRESASVAHLYGQNLVAAESFTTNIAPFGWSPEMLKPTADRALALGLNRFVIHTSVHQPLPEHAPGLSLGPFGQWFTRNETWAEQASPWISYLARSSWLMQQGRAVADILYFYGEDSNITALFGERAPPIPPGFDFDYVNADALCNLLSVRDGRLVSPSGAQYRVLALDPNSRHMSLPVLRKIRDLVAAGAAVVGGRPLASPSLGDDAAEFAQITSDLWDGNKIADTSETGAAMEKRLAALPLEPDFAYSRPRDDTRLLFAHRQLPDGELYFVSSRNAVPQRVEASFRVTGKIAEVWHADTGSMERVSFRVAQGRTSVPLDLPAYGAVFVVFRSAATVESFEAPRTNDEVVASVAGPWDIRFQKGRGAPERISEAALGSWTANADPGVKFFSGTATYETTIKLPARAFAAGSRLSLDLGAVANLAEVSVNGKPLGTVWKAPFTVDATAALKPGVNHIEIGVTNLWVNRLIGDQQPGVTKPIAFTVSKPYGADAPLLPSGLLGPVHIVRRSAVPAARH